MDKFFEIATRVSNQWSLAAFTIAAVVALVLLLTRRRVPTIAWVVVVAVVLIAIVPIVAPLYLDNFGVYRVRVTVIRNGVPVEDAQVKCSLGGEVLKGGSGWECDIPAKFRPTNRQLTVFVADPSAFMRASRTVQLQADYAPALALELEADSSARLHGTIVEETEQRRPLARAHVYIVGYASEEVVTDASR